LFIFTEGWDDVGSSDHATLFDTDTLARYDLVFSDDETAEHLHVRLDIDHPSSNPRFRLSYYGDEAILFWRQLSGHLGMPTKIKAKMDAYEAAAEVILSARRERLAEGPPVLTETEVSDVG
jgi:hypothetical protein